MPSLQFREATNSFHGDLQTFRELERAMSRLENSPLSSESSYLSLLKACAKSRSLSIAKRLHAHFAHCIVDVPRSIGEHLVLALSRCGAFEDALTVLRRLPHRTAFSWTAIISSLTDSLRGHDALSMHQHMVKDGVDPDPYTFVALFKACGCVSNLEFGKVLHAQARSKGFTSDVFVCSALVCMYGKCGAIADAEAAFTEISQHNVVSWTAMMSAYVDHGEGMEALLSYMQMISEGFNPNQATYVVAIQACGIIAEKEENRKLALEIGCALHADAHKKGLAADAFVGTTLVSMYGKCGALPNAEHSFNCLLHPLVPSWNSMISAYVETGQIEKALQLYAQMLDKGLNPDQQSFVFTLQACSTLAKIDEKEEFKIEDEISIKVMALKLSQALHMDASTHGLASDVFVATTLLSTYGKCGEIAEAENVFNASINRNLVTWNAMLSAYTEQSESGKAALLFRQMLKEGVCIDDVTCVCVLQASCELGSLDICSQVHFIVVCIGYNHNFFLMCTLIHAYGSCSNMKDMEEVFDALPHLDVVLLNACVTGHAGEGNFAACHRMFEELQLAGLKPDGVTFTSLLSSCSHVGFVDEGAEYFVFMSTHYRIPAESTHYVCMVDLFGRVGDFARVDSILKRMKKHNALAMWSCVLGACQTHGNVEMGKLVFLHAINVQPEDSAAYVLMSNMQAYANVQDGANNIEVLERDGREVLSYQRKRDVMCTTSRCTVT